MGRPFKVVGHRGMPSRYPENSLISIEKAIEAGVDAVEFDIHLTRDHRLVVTHDDTVDRCSNGKGAVRDFSFDEIRALDFGSWKGKEFVGTRIPTFEETLDAILSRCAADFQILIEIKEDDEACTRLMLEELRRRKIIDRCVVLSFFANQLALLHAIEPELQLQGFRMKDFHRTVSNVYDFLMRLCIWRDALTAAEIEAFHKMNIQVDTCPVDNVEQLDHVLKFDVDTVTTNAADHLMPLLRERGLRPPE